MKLSDGIDEYIAFRKGVGMAKNTIRSESQALGLLLSEVGNIQMKKLDVRHGEMFTSAMLGAGLAPGTVNLYRGALSRFASWAQQRRYVNANGSPLATTRNVPDPKAPKRRVPAHEFPRLLDACTHPQQRVIVALGLYLFLRASEVQHLDVAHVNLDAGEILVYQPKTRRYDEMPICAELDAELRRWLTWYATDVAETHGSIQPTWPLVPARTKCSFANETGKSGGRPVLPETGQINPTRRAGQVHLKVQAALRSFGWEVTPDDREGVHTLRRSGARALFDHLVETGKVRDGALRVVAAMLHHRSVTVTELYLGLEADRENRNRLFRGANMFAAPVDNVIELKEKMG